MEKLKIVMGSRIEEEREKEREEQEKENDIRM